ncbi:predicted protein [Uncinocarpus reesii 1704]|uniref:Helicase/UvrB N-terminal domain-containing protein n=1 Tax=Uncinocarpus reesii (strain UAMH 1704) TaxID=336963 RepID=C4JRZ1_UNCRE|nr:uncharacterized protein UREG_05230 [Uncinocarpus reesii 1704]EEP80388.1 predicted protein [Uncinocarpus reesii 1704]
MGSPSVVDEPNDRLEPEPAGFSELAESDSEDDSSTNKENVSDVRRQQNLRFKNLLLARAEKVTAEDIQKAIKVTKDSELSMSNILAKQDFASVVHDPREYQLELFEKAKTNNIIAVLDTGITIAFFSPCFFVTLVFQQAAVLQNQIDQKIDKFCGAMETHLWDGETWAKHLANNMVIVCTAEVLHQCLLHSFVKMENINLLIFDEAHHAKKDHPYAR